MQASNRKRFVDVFEKIEHQQCCIVLAMLLRARHYAVDLRIVKTVEHRAYLYAGRAIAPMPE